MESSEVLELYYSLKEEYEEIVKKIVEYEMLRDGLKEIQGGETYINIGGLIFTRVEIKNPDKVMVNVGNNIFIEKSREEVIETLSKAIEELEKVKTDIEQQLDQIREKIKNSSKK